MFGMHYRRLTSPTVASHRGSDRYFVNTGFVIKCANPSSRRSIATDSRENIESVIPNRA